jgi:hypothetical protein
MKNKIFISHSSKDYKIVELFVEKILKLGLGIPSERIFCTSLEGQGIKSGKYIPDELKIEINKASIALLFISDSYRKSEICQNEVGAAWAVLEKGNVIPILLPNIDFNELGILNLHNIGIKINEINGLFQLIDDHKEQLSTNYQINVLNKYINIFLKELDKISNSSSQTKKSESTILIERQHDCYENNLFPFGDLIRQVIPEYEDGIFEIKQEKDREKMILKLSNQNFLEKLWYRFAEGDSYVQNIRKLNKDTWLFLFWELKISKMWVSKSASHQNEFILIYSEAKEPFKINSDIGGESHHVGMLNDGTIISETERYNGYAKINGETIDIAQKEVKLRYRDNESHWVFIGTDYHKIGYNPDETMDFCSKLDSREINVNAENLSSFISKLRNPPITITGN